MALVTRVDACCDNIATLEYTKDPNITVEPDKLTFIVTISGSLLLKKR